MVLKTIDAGKMYFLHCPANSDVVTLHELKEEHNNECEYVKKPPEETFNQFWFKPMKKRYSKE